MAKIKIDQFNDYYNAELIGVFHEDVAILGGGDTEEEAIANMKANAETWLEYVIDEAKVEQYCNGYRVEYKSKDKKRRRKMKEYKRLTERTKHGIAVLDSGERFVLSCGGYATTKALNRLAELEDKIENGTLVPKYSIVDCGDTHCVCAVDTNNLLVIGEYETKAEAKKALEEIRK